MNFSRPSYQRLLLAVLLLVPCWSQSEDHRIRQLIANYAAAVDAADIKLAAQVWDNSPDVSFIHPLGHAHGRDEVKRFFTDVMGGLFSERKLTPRDIKVHVQGDSGWSEFYWRFAPAVSRASPNRERQGASP